MKDDLRYWVASSNLRPYPVDILVFAPHPDDEILGTAGIIMQAIAAGKRVHVVFFTNGDGYPKAASYLLHKRPEELGPADYLELSRVRQLEAYNAAALIGLSPMDLTFLGYPDAGLDRVYNTVGNIPYQQPFTQRSSTYGMLTPDFHSLVYGYPAPYRKDSALRDTMTLISIMQPSEIYVTDAADGHLDHKAANAFVMEAVSLLHYPSTVYTYVIHSGPDSQWPWPRGITPEQPFQAHEFEGKRIPLYLPWPPPVRQPLNLAQAYCKWRALLAYRSQIAVDSEFLQSFIKCEEIFWLPERS
ncbi:hypothetical protein GC098_17055 [Paenibacillus sp. LMG 31458]|uniref:PIG-L family deacetylase n=1 Tax=Paenibacillus phytorum TaxID=2654977 RepID=A0ABX1XX55_9BACL|nr:PIG-L family deacetylase [Paenibacillus phytorum]NOU73106.1 hypothetical protein [Paenibacillus phytorum]